MPLFLDTLPTVPEEIKNAPKRIQASGNHKACEFDLETLEELAEMYGEENSYDSEARVRLIDGNIVLTVVDREDRPENRLIVYYVENTPGLFQDMDKKYVEALLNSESSGNDFWDKWNAVLETLSPCKIVDDTFEAI